MRKLGLALLFLVVVAVAGVALAGERIIGNGCTITVADAGVGSSANDTDCTWNDGQWLSMQCDGGVYYSKDGTTPAAATHPFLQAGDPYPMAAQRSSVTNAIKVQPTAGNNSVTCNIFASDSL